MSKTIDEKVVEMRFDNKQFESNVATSMSTLEKLKKSLKFDGATKGLEDINSAVKRVDMNGLGGAVETVKAKFSALDVVAVTALANITNSAVNAGKRLVSSLSIDQVASGWQKFSDKTTSAATLVAQGNAIEEVNKQLKQLNWFTDETSYNFTDMVSNIAKFTATGKSLEESVTAMEGIATWAALSGQNAATASRAMYQLSQALSAGFMRKEDWKSIQNASMDTDEFRQKTLDAAVALGTLKENADGTYTSLMTNAKSATNFTKTQFVESLTEGAWFTSDVMMNVYKEYASAVDSIMEEVEKSGGTASQVISEIHDKANELKTETMSDSEAIDAAIKELGYTLEDGSLKFDSFGLKAFEAGQQARTFKDAIDSVKDAVSTGWMNTFEYIFGDANKATELWTDVANQLWDIFAGGGERRNSILDTVMTSKWDKLTAEITNAGGSIDVFESKIKESAKEHGYAIDHLIKKYGSLSAVISAGKLSKGVIVEAIKKMSGTFTKTSEAVETTTASLEHFQDMVNKVIRGEFGSGIARVNALTEAGENAVAIQTLVNKVWERNGQTWKNTTITAEDLAEVIGDLSTEELKSVGYTEEQANALKALAEEAEKTGTPINELIESLSRPSGQELIFNTIHNALASVSGVVGTFRDAWAEIFTEDRVASGLYNTLSSIESFSERVVKSIDDNAEKLKSTFKGLIAIFDIITSLVGGALKAGFKIFNEIVGNTGSTILDVTSNVGDAIAAFRDWLFQNDYITKIFNKLVDAAKSVINVVKRWINAFKNIPAVSRLLEDVHSLFTSIGDASKDMDGTAAKVKDWISSFEELPIVKSLLEGISSAFNGIADIVEKSITAVGEWFEAFKETEGVQEFASAVSDLVSSVGKLFSGEIDVSEFASTLGSSLAKLLVSLPKIAIQFGKDFIAGFSNGLGEGVSELIGNVIEFCSNFCSAFAETLGIHSPSTISYQNAIDWCQGFINGLKDMLEPVLKALQPIIDGVKMVFSSFWDYITDDNGDLEWDKIIAGGITIESLIILKTLADSFEKIANAFTSVTGVLDAFKGALKGLKKALSGMAWDFKANAILKLSISLGILVAAVIAIAKIGGDDIGKMWNAVGIVAALAIVLAGLAWAMNLLSSTTVKWDKGPQIEGIKSGLLQIGLAILMVAAAVKMIGDLDDDQAKRGMISLAAIASGMLVFLAAMGGISRYSKDVSGIGGMMIKLSFAMLLMVGVCKMIGLLSPEDIGKGVLFSAAFAIFVMSITAVAKGADKDIAKVGSMVTKIAFAMTLMVGVCKLAGMLSKDEMIKGAAFAGAFAIFVAILVGLTKMGYEQHVESVGGLVLGVSVSLLMMVGVCKIAGMLTWKELVKGLVCVGVLTGLIIAMVAILKVGDAQQLTKVGGTIIAMSTALMIMAGTAVILGMVDTKDLAKGITAVSILGIIMALMVHGLKGANSVKGEIIAMTVAIALLAGCVVALSFIDDKESLKAAVESMAILMSIFAIMLNSLRGLEKGKIPIGTIYAMTGVIAILAGVIALLTYAIKDTNSAIYAAMSLSVLILTMSVVLRILNGMKVDVDGAFNASLALAAMAIPLLAFAAVLGLASGIDNAEKNVLALVGLAAAMTVLLIPLTVLGKFASNGLGTSVVTGIVALTGMAIPLWVFIQVLKEMNGIEDASEKIKALVTAMTAMTLLLGALTIIGAFGPAAVIGVGSLVVLFAAIGLLATGIGALMEKFPSIQKFLDTGLPVLEQLAGSIGTMVGNFIGGIGEGLSDSLVKMGEDISEFMDQLKVASDNASGIKGESFDGVKKLMGVMAEIGGTSIITGFTDMISEYLTGDDSMTSFVNNAKTFFSGMKAAMSELDGVTFNESGLDCVIRFASKLADLEGSLNGIYNVAEWLTGHSDLDVFRSNAKQFFSSMKSAMSELDGASFNEEGLNSVMSFSERLAGLESSLNGLYNVIEWLTGRSDLDVFRSNAKQFLNSMKIAMSELDGVTFNEEGLNYVMSFAERLANLQSSINGMESFIEWMLNIGDLDVFAKNAKRFLNAMKTSMLELDGVTFNEEGLNYIISYSERLSEFQSSIDGMAGFISWITGVTDLGLFGANAYLFLDAMKTSMSALDGVTFNEGSLDYIISFAERLAGIQNSLDGIQDFMSFVTGLTDLDAFKNSAKTFIESMKEAMSSVNGCTFDEVALNSLLDASERLSEFQSTLEPMGGVISWFSGRDDLGTFGTNIGLFADAMSKLKTGMGEDGITEATITSITNTGTALIELQKALPEEHWFDGKMNLSEFSTYVSDFATAMSDFGSKASEIDSGAVSTVISTAYRIKSLINSLVDLDTSGLAEFTGVGTGGFGADGAAYKIAQSISAYSNKVKDIDTEAVSVSVSSAMRLRTLINNLSSLDTSGIENFKPDSIGKAMKTYADKVSGIDTSTVSSSITSANRLKTFISGLAGLDTSGISNFRVGSIGTALKAYGESVSGTNFSAISSSIASANRLKSFISSLAGLDISGVSSFTTAINKLSSSNTKGFIAAFSGISKQMVSVGARMIDMLATGMKTKISSVLSAIDIMFSKLNERIKSKQASFKNAGSSLINAFATGIRSKVSSVSSAATSGLSSAISAIQRYRQNFYAAGKYLVEGFATGIRLYSWVSEKAASSMAQKAIDAANKTLDENSPSKVFIKIGGYVARGFGIGINRDSSVAEEAASSMASGAINKVRSAISDIGNMISNDIDAQPTIRPIVDLTDVKTGAAAASGMFDSLNTIGVRSNLNAITVAMNGKLQNGSNDDVISAINKLGTQLESSRGDTYNFGDFTYDDGSEVADAIGTLIRYAKIGRRV